MPLPTLRDPRNKDLGAYYTEARVAAALCRWAMRGREGRLLDPAFGGGVFLDAAAEQGRELGRWELLGVELDPAAHDALANRASFSPLLVQGDFFSLDAGALPPMSAVVGNPPFIRFQRFAGEARGLARKRALEAGLALPPLAGSWVAFVAHAMTFLEAGGRLAMVVPGELGHAPSARPLLELLHRRFAATTFVSFRRSLFPHLDQQTLLLLADGYGETTGRFTALELAGPEHLERPLPRAGDLPLNPTALIEGASSLAHSSLEPAALALYDRLGLEAGTVRLGELARVESGYVTGANSYFHLSPAEAVEAGLPQEVLVPALFRSRALTGLRFAEEEWRVAVQAGWAGYLVQAAGFEEEPAVARFLAHLRAAGVDRRYKARTRSPWYRIGRVVAPPLVLPAMGGARLPLVVNERSVAVSNTFHAVTPLPGRQSEPAPPAALAACWLTSLTDLSLELEGHRLGGGLLKLDPGEALRVLLPSPALLSDGRAERLESLARGECPEDAREEADRLLLEEGLGLSKGEVLTLRRAAGELRSRRKRS